MIPNIIYAVKHKDDDANTYNNKAVVIAEQVGRYGCFVLMIFNIPYTYFNFWFSHALTVYLAVNGGLCLAYLIFWIICWKRSGKLKALSLSIIPSCVFLFSGVVLANIPLLAFAVVFAITHIFISYKNAVISKRRKKTTVEEKLKNEVILIFVLILVAFAVIGTIFGDASGSAFPLK